ncbi:G-protein alpha subunit-domain-containing protein [Mycena alexandri]|uniref:G-protein alpha subunit-domain-containing protein n=1 Tax=Mycena alexandri TaxID=1745969 RepID=A0AAD6SCN3_9AGAR|nr:G-protein alpha subunit-domain-containing protein [Mycena alexandri]
MGGVPSSPVDHQAKARNDEIENPLKRDRQMSKNEIKMLVLGAGESGKSTVLKQMKIINADGYNAQKREAYKEIIYSNTIQSMRAILEAMPQLDIALASQNDARCATIMCLPPQIEADFLPRDLADAVRGLWRERANVEWSRAGRRRTRGAAAAALYVRDGDGRWWRRRGVDADEVRCPARCLGGCPVASWGGVVLNLYFGLLAASGLPASPRWLSLGFIEI